MVRYKQIFYFILVFVFIIGGSLQYKGILSNTVGTLLITMFLITLTMSKGRKSHLNYNPFIYLAFIIVASALLNRTQFALLGLYFIMFAMVPIAIFRFVAQRVINHIDETQILNFFFGIGLIQLPVIIFQKAFSSQIASGAARDLHEIDVAFGTFFMANDHGLCFLLISLIIYLLFQVHGMSASKKRLYIIWFTVTVAVSNSNISLFLLLLVFVYYFASKISVGTIIVSMLSITALYVIVLATPALNEAFNERVEFFDKKLDREQDANDIQRKVDARIADRNEIVAYYATKEVFVLGNGPYDYFNPMTGQFKSVTNFSQYIWFYNDIGVLGVISVILIYTAVYVRHYSFKDHRLLWLGLVLVYSFFTNTLSDLSFNIVLAFFILKDSKYFKTHKNELSLHSVSRLA